MNGRFCCVCGKTLKDGEATHVGKNWNFDLCCKSPACIQKCKEERKARSEQHKKELRARWYQEHKAEILAKRKDNRKYNAQKNKEWKDTHKEQINQHIRERKQVDPVYKLKCQARTMIYQSFARTGNVKQGRCESIVGLTIDNFITYLEGTYERNYGKQWDGVEAVHIDHIIPLATAQSAEDVKRLCHYSNLQLLTAQDNLKKGCKV